MEVPFDPDLQAKISRLATQQGRNVETLVREAVERLTHRGEFVEHDDVRKLIDTRYPG